MSLFSFFGRGKRDEQPLQPTPSQSSAPGPRDRPLEESAVGSSAAPAAGPEAVQPVTQAQLKRILDSQDWNWFVDNEGDLGGTWNDSQFFFILTGEHKTILQIQSTWHNAVDMKHLDDVRRFILKWHHDRLWPKCYHRITDSGRIRVYTENIQDWQQGATDAQLLQQIKCAIGTANNFYEALAERLED